MTPNDSPALKFRATDYPARFNGAVPKTVVMHQYVQPDEIVQLIDPSCRDMACHPGNEYPVWVNSYGAVAAILPDGRQLGLKPDEFGVVEWHIVNCCPACHLSTGDGRICPACAADLVASILKAL